MSNLPDSISACVSQAPRLVQDNPDKRIIEAAFIFPENDPERFPGFDGHFPGNPIVPGIVQLMAAAYTASLGTKTRIRSVKRCKFTRPVRAAEVVFVRVECSAASAGECSARLEANGEVCAEALFALAGEDEGLCP